MFFILLPYILIAWMVAGMALAYSLEPRVVKMALIVLLSAALWPVTWWTSRRSKTEAHLSTNQRPTP